MMFPQIAKIALTSLECTLAPMEPVGILGSPVSFPPARPTAAFSKARAAPAEKFDPPQVSPVRWPCDMQGRLIAAQAGSPPGRRFQRTLLSDASAVGFISMNSRAYPGFKNTTLIPIPFPGIIS